MQQLSGLDAAFLYLETGQMPMHIGSLAIYDQSTAPGGHVGFKDILRFYEQRLHTARAFRRRAVHVPLELDHPYWIEDPDFNLEYHIRHLALPKPGDWRQLCIQTSRLHARPLDGSKPLWEAWVIEGLDNVAGVPPGSFAVVSKFHHAAIDGVSAAEITSAFHGLTPDAAVDGTGPAWQPEDHPTRLGLLARSAVSSIRQPVDMARLALRNIPTAARVGKGVLTGDFGLQLKVPKTRFNDNVSAHRVFDARGYSLDEIRAMRNAVPGATVNDVVVSICGGALRKYLAAKGELPEESLVAMAPVSARSGAERRDEGNLVTTMSLPVGSDIADPLERLAAVCAESRKAKKLTATIGPSLAAEAAQFLPSMTTGLLARAYGRSGLARRLPLFYNLIITNVPGAPTPLYSMGSRLVAIYGLGPVAHGLGLFQPVVSYNGKVMISAVSCREMMPDPSFYCQCLDEAYAELLAAATTRGGFQPGTVHQIVK